MTSGRESREAARVGLALAERNVVFSGQILVNLALTRGKRRRISRYCLPYPANGDWSVNVGLHLTNIHSVVTVQQSKPAGPVVEFLCTSGYLETSGMSARSSRRRATVTKARSIHVERRMTKRAVVLAAGTGSRLGEAGVDLPKPIRPVAGQALLVRVFAHA